VLALGTGIALPAIPVLAKSFGVSFGLASGVITAFLFGGTVGTVPTGWLIDRVGRRKVMLAGPLLTSAVALLVMTAHSFPQLLVYRFLDGFAAQMWLMGRLAAITDRARADQRGRQVTWMYGMDNVGKLSGPVVGGFVAAAWGVRSPFAAYALLALLALIPTFRYIEDSTPRRQPGASGGDIVRLSVAQMVLPRLAMFGVAFFAAVARGPIFADLLHLYAAFAYNLDAKGVGFLATGANLLALPIGFAAGFMLDHIGRKRTIVPGFAGVTVTMLLLAVTAVLGLSLQWYVVVFLAGVAFQSLTGGSIQTIATDVAPRTARGMFLGLWRFTSQAGIVVGPVIFAFLADRTGYASAFVFIAAVALVVTVLLITRVPETGKMAAASA
jgi:MFS family permease